MENENRLGDLLLEWLFHENKWKPSTLGDYYTTVTRHLNPLIGALRPEELDAEQLRRCVEGLREKGFSKQQYAKAKAILKGYLGQREDGRRLIQELEFIPFQPRRTKEESWEEAPDQRIKAFDRRQQSQLEQAALELPDYKGIGVLLAVNLGLRIGEICGLKWEDIDWADRTLTIRRTVLRVKNFAEEGGRTRLVLNRPKSRTSYRTIPIPRGIYKLLERCHNQRTAVSEFVVCTKSGAMTEPRSYRRLYQKLVEAAKLSRVSFHGLRHTFATRGLESGMDIKTLSELLGHSNTTVTLNIYAHSMMEEKRRGIDRIEALNRERYPIGA